MRRRYIKSNPRCACGNRMQKRHVCEDRTEKMVLFCLQERKRLRRMKLKKGDVVKHHKFGTGIVTTVDPSTYCIIMVIVQLDSGEKVIRPLNEWVIKEENPYGKREI